MNVFKQQVRVAKYELHHLRGIWLQKLNGLLSKMDNIYRLPFIGHQYSSALDFVLYFLGQMQIGPPIDH